MPERVTIPILAERIARNKADSDQQFEKIEKQLDGMKALITEKASATNRLIIGAGISVVASVIVGVLSKVIGG